jgi:MFS superfamily sulfate permease-like transporter
MNFRRLLPFIDWLTRYERSWLSLDLVAGITLAAYASLAGLRPGVFRDC